MDVALSDRPLLEDKADALVVGVFDDKRLEGPAATVNEASGGVLQRMLEDGDLPRSIGSATKLFSLAGVAAPVVVVTGLGARDKWAPGACAQAAGTAAKQLADRARETVRLALADPLSPELTTAAVCGAMAGCHGQDLYRGQRKTHPFAKLIVSGDDDAQAALDEGQALGEAVNLTRRLVNEPPQEIYPESFAAEAQRVAGETGLEIEVWDEDQLANERMEAMLAVARASSRPPRLVILRHGGDGRQLAPLYLVGKGVTFDSGGLSLKSNASMTDMKCDMAGAATVLGVMQAIARLKLPMPVVGMMGLVENMPGGAAMKLGDVLTARNGRTIEVMNTDAEGRLVLADALSLAVDQGAGRIIDLATLTGACVVALGTDVVGVLSNDEDWSRQVQDAAAAMGELCWPLPMFDVFDDLVKSEVADIKNSTGIRWGGTITAAKFLSHFVGNVPWVHLDIAGPAFLEKPKPWLDAGGTGVMVRSLVELIRRSG